MKQGKHAAFALAVLLAASLACGSSGGPTEAPKIKTATPEIVATDAPASGTPDSEGQTLEPTATKKPLPTATDRPTLEPTAEPQEGYLGDFIEQDGVILAALQVEDPATPGVLYQKEEGKRLVAVEVVIGNLDEDPFSVSPLYMTLLDADGFAYETDLGGQAAVGLQSVTIAPGERARGWVAFQVPDEAELAAIRFAPFFTDTRFQTNVIPRPDGAAPIEMPPHVAPELSLLGDVVEQGGYSLSAITLEDPTPKPQFVTVASDYRLVSVEIVVANISGAELSASIINCYLVDTAGYVYGAEIIGRDGALESVDLQEGDRSKGWVTFSIPDSATPEAIKYEANSFTGLFLMAGLASP